MDTKNYSILPYLDVVRILFLLLLPTSSVALNLRFLPKNYKKYSYSGREKNSGEYPSAKEASFHMIAPASMPPPTHRSRSKKFQSFSVSLGRKRLCHFFDFFPPGRPAMPRSRQAPSPASMSPPSEQVEKISKFFRFLRKEKTLSFF